ncbi:MAG: macro domain-containing protein [Silvanigrellaceae bacterium]|nr:macro domain-containing protein [Silvanigrellaceae bacterium]
MIHFQNVHENIFNLYPEAIAHPVNCVGICRDTLSKQLKKSYSDYFKEYSRHCIRKQLAPGKLELTKLSALFGTRFIITCPVKYNWQESTNPVLIKLTISHLIPIIIENNIQSIAVPELPEAPKGWLIEEFKKQFLDHNSQSSHTILLFHQENP